MGVVNGTPVDAPTTNAAFIAKNAADSMPFPLTLNNSATASGSTVTDIQKELNSISSFLGKALNSVYNLLPTWATSNRGTSSDTILARIAALDTAFHATTGHKHTGAAGDAPLLPLANLATGNVLGNISGSPATPAAVPVASLATVSTMMLRDANGNVSAVNFNVTFATTATAAGTTTLVVGSAGFQQFTGTTTQNVALPDATTLPQTGWDVIVANRSTGIVTVKNNAGTTLQAMAAGTQCIFTCSSIATSAGTWDIAYTGGVSAGGGGGGSLQWVEITNPPDSAYENQMLVYRFEAGTTNQLNTSIRVPTSYVAGSPIKLKLPYYSPDSSGTALISAQATLIRTGVDAVTSTANVRTTTNAAVTLTVANLSLSATLDVSDSIGHVNGVSISAGDTLQVYIYRGTDTATSAIKAIVNDAEVTFT